MVILILATLLNANALRGAKSWVFWRLQEPPLHVRDNQKMVQRVHLIESITSPDATIAVQWAGILPYFSDRRVIDLLGKNDRRIAHLPMHRGPGLRWFHPGHLKWDLSYSIGELQPDVIEQPWTRDQQAAAEWLQDFSEVEVDGLRVDVREGSDKILRVSLTPLRKADPVPVPDDSLQMQP